MSTVLKPVIDDQELNNSSSSTLKTRLFFNNRKAKYGIKCKENYFKHKCNKALKNKLKKYKLRKDGKEDPDVINVSHSFQCLLRIKSPSNNNNAQELNIYERPKNYLFKMVRRKRDVEIVKGSQTLFKDSSTDKTKENQEFDNEEVFHENSQDKKHTNAFKLMMDSRNKSIGGNSPGKEKNIDSDNLQSIKEEKINKAKRLLVLQKMAEEKGSLKKKEKEELLEEAIKKKMEKRAQRLANMLVSRGGNKESKTKKAKPKNNKECPTKLSTYDEKNQKLINNEKKIGTLNLINMFHDSDKVDSNDFDDQHVPKEDLEFIKKLSPSIRKKENMLCYFKKLEKNDDDSTSELTEDIASNSPIIKVKFAGKHKKRNKKKLSLKSQNSFDSKDENQCPEINMQIEKCTPSNIDSISKSDTRKRKREQEEISNHVIDTKTQPIQLNENNVGRPKRNVRKPIQYQVESVLSSSDEEYNIFTPKKKKHVDKKSDSPNIKKDLKVISNKVSNVTKQSTKSSKHRKNANNNDLNIKKNNVKLAPIFAPKPLLDPIVLEAKQKFLQSGVPEKLKKTVNQQKRIESNANSFTTVVHIQQIFENSQNSSSIDHLVDFEMEADFSPKKSSDIVYKKLLSIDESNVNPSQNKKLVKPDNNVRNVLQNIKLSYPTFPVYRTYHLLKAKSKGEFGYSHFPELDNSLEIINNVVESTKVQVDKLNWTDKYKPMATNQIIGNFETIRELKKWLEAWSLHDTRKKNDKDDSDSSDFCYSDPDSRDSIKTVDNLLILTGPTGCGKTACVYAAAAELAIKVIEVNASSKRNGKIMIQDLQEATQSHKVNRAKGSSTENSQKSQEIIEDCTVKVKKRGRPKKSKDGALEKPKREVLSQSTNSQENGRTCMSLILIDDADIVFEQDEGFCSAINQLIQYSKRPVILITTSSDCTHLQRFLQSGKIMKMKPLLPRMLGTWLDIMCLADSATCWPGLGSVLLDIFRGDIRKTINCLQFYASTHNKKEDEEVEEFSPSSYGFHDENSSTSWAGSDIPEDRQTVCSKLEGDTVWKHFLDQERQLVHSTLPSDLCNVWWNLSGFFTAALDNGLSEDHVEEKRIRDLNEIANVVDNISAVDYLSQLRPDTRTNICSKPWYSSECDSCSECENFSYYSNTVDVSDEISKTLIVRSICNAQEKLQCSNESYVKPTGLAVQRDRDRIVSRHHKISAHLNPVAVLDRKALALDYWSSCRTICRFEKFKTDTNSKRNNRYCHYLRSLKIMCNSEVFDKLGDSLNAKEKDV